MLIVVCDAIEKSMNLLQTMRWYGPQDIVSLQDIRQAGAHGVVNALHEIPVGSVWSQAAIRARKHLIEWDDVRQQPTGLFWSVVESVNVHESIKKGHPERDIYINNYIETIHNLAACGVSTICYNFMPLLDWTRTDLDYVVADGSKALRYDIIRLAVFDIHILGRKGAKGEYTSDIVAAAADCYKEMSDEQRSRLQETVLAGLPGTQEVIPISDFRALLKQYEAIDADRLRDNLTYFLLRIIPAAEAVGVRMCIHPDDPPYPIFGLPRVVSTEGDLEYLTQVIYSPSNGITFCTGSLGPNAANDLPGMVRRLGAKFHFVHLRNVKRETNGSFYEADHLDGSVDMYEVMEALIEEMDRRAVITPEIDPLPFRPDHGHQMLDDLRKDLPFHGYGAIGRLRGLAELRGLEMGIRRSRSQR